VGTNGKYSLWPGVGKETTHHLNTVTIVVRSVWLEVQYSRFPDLGDSNGGNDSSGDQSGRRNADRGALGLDWSSTVTPALSSSSIIIWFRNLLQFPQSHG
jgi:hypothetical protein